MFKKEILTTFEAAAICNVSYNTIKNWIKRGLLSAYRTAGGHLRIRSGDLEGFSREYGMPLYEKNDSTRRKVLILDNGNSFRAVFDESFGHYIDKIEVHSTADPFEAGVLVEMMKPDLIVINPRVPCINGVKICNHIRRSPSMKHVKVALLTDSSMNVGNGKLEEMRADLNLAIPVDKVSLLESIEPIIMPKKGVRSRKRKKTAANP